MQPDPRTNLSNQLADTLTNRSVAPDEKREITITFRASHAEKARLEQRCTGVVQSDYIRARLFDYPLPHPKLVIPEVNRQAIYELKKIGNNLNQQTKAINEAVKIGSQPLTNEVKSYLRTIEELTTLLEQTRQLLTQTTVEGQHNDYQSQS
ncbi:MULTISPECIES: plasmid mobilization protein [Nostoc]|uniref:Plasmid mobilization relaxosome protein MobC n=2 Tax=Nostoc TaxID=1177 RepID=A0ABR8IHL6_9NOSO|nr:MULTISPECIES: plasmid mobilization relaxosome protein MobC [Nostoc]MBD2565266.1 plasmid mobilization relaxosome protein MobC [Nostoc linckia FACHB-391]MBD2650978.1 plasmid mobilization relaxosome protein MobC [Nostoc foliaceum FACHB-393]